MPRCSATILLLHRRLLDVLQVGEEEADALGVNASRVRIAVVIAATLGTAAAVAVTGLIGFVGIIVAHTVRMVTKGSYRVVLPLSMIGGAAFLVLADVIARSVQSPAELPIGVVTAFFGAPFFLLVLSRSGTDVNVVIRLDAVSVRFGSGPRVVDALERARARRASGWRCSARTGPARARCCGRSPACCPTRAASRWTAAPPRR